MNFMAAQYYNAILIYKINGSYIHILNKPINVYPLKCIIYLIWIDLDYYKFDAQPDWNYWCENYFSHP